MGPGEIILDFLKRPNYFEFLLFTKYWEGGRITNDCGRTILLTLFRRVIFLWKLFLINVAG